LVAKRLGKSRLTSESAPEPELKLESTDLKLEALSGDNRTRLDQFVVAGLARVGVVCSRQDVKRQVLEGKVTLQGHDGALSVSRVVRAGETFVWQVLAPALTTAVAEPGIAFDVLHEDRDVIVVNKPAGLVVHPAAGHPRGTLVNGLLGRGYFLAEDIGDGHTNLRPGIVHRIDKDTSGVLVVARSSAAREHLKAQFAKHSIEREYWAIALGDVGAQTFRTLHGRHPQDRKRFSSHVREGKRAVTYVEPVSQLGPATLVRCLLETGRTHQIRMHLAEAGTPILGDMLYAKPPKLKALQTIVETMGHHALHARVLGFIHPRSGKNMRFEAAPPATFQGAVEALKALPTPKR
jgi:23S rRNA pseudouridine1911/1915/1917 synthase